VQVWGGHLLVDAVEASASLTPSARACCGVMPVISVAIGEGSRSSAGREEADRLVDLVEVSVGADRGELGDARAARVLPKVSRS
jgi:hypothetical protein